MSKVKLEKQAIDNMKKSMTKKAYLEYQKLYRNTSNMNTGTRTHKNTKDYNRQNEKQKIKDFFKNF